MMTTEKFDIEKLIETELQSLPSSTLRISSLLQDVNASTRAIAEAIGYDPAFATRILRAANSPLYMTERRVTTLPGAVLALGNQTINALAIISAAADTFGQSARHAPGVKHLWEHSVATGLLARELSQLLGMRGSEEAFLCGLLHDMGKLLLLRYDAELYSQVLECDDEHLSLRMEQEIYGFTHAQVGALISKRWQLPEEIGYAIYGHHQPSEASQHMFMARLIDVASRIPHAAAHENMQDEECSIFSAESVLALRLSPEQIQQVWAKAESKLGEMMTCFG